MQYVQQPKAQS